MKKIISYSLWGTDEKYVNGAIENIKNQRQFYPDWVCRFYIHDSVPSYVYHRIKNDGCEIVDVHENIEDEAPYKSNQIHKGHFWRFEVLSDKTIDYVMVRDVDSRIYQREVNCVKDWIASGKEFHIMRDHVMHGVPICAGMWGATKNFIHRIDYESIKKNFNEPHNANLGGYDQFFLAKCIYPLVRDTACIHDDWDRYKEGARKVPHFRMNGEFIAKQG